MPGKKKVGNGRSKRAKGTTSKSKAKSGYEKLVAALRLVGPPPANSRTARPKSTVQLERPRAAAAHSAVQKVDATARFKVAESLATADPLRYHYPWTDYGSPAVPATPFTLHTQHMFEIPAGNVCWIFADPRHTSGTGGSSMTALQYINYAQGYDMTGVYGASIPATVSPSDIFPPNEHDSQFGGTYDGTLAEADSSIFQVGPGCLEVECRGADALVAPPSLACFPQAARGTEGSARYALDLKSAAAHINRHGSTHVPFTVNPPVLSTCYGYEYPTAEIHYQWAARVNTPAVLGVTGGMPFHAPLEAQTGGYENLIRNVMTFGGIRIHNRHPTAGMTCSVKFNRQLNLSIPHKMAENRPDILTKYVDYHPHVGVNIAASSWGTGRSIAHAAQAVLQNAAGALRGHSPSASKALSGAVALAHHAGVPQHKALAAAQKVLAGGIAAHMLYKNRGAIANAGKKAFSLTRQQIDRINRANWSEDAGAITTAEAEAEATGALTAGAETTEGLTLGEELLEIGEVAAEAAL